eukprot:Skav211762  [mRNA]  locus=scaffold674:192648:194427:+ [translate_table: standard]
MISPEGYSELVLAGKNLDEDEAIRVIQADLHRTGMDGVDEAALENLLLAFAAKNPKIGYCQSMSFVAATLLMYMPEVPPVRRRFVRRKVVALLVMLLTKRSPDVMLQWCALMILH